MNIASILTVAEMTAIYQDHKNDEGFEPYYAVEAAVLRKIGERFDWLQDKQGDIPVQWGALRLALLGVSSGAAESPRDIPHDLAPHFRKLFHAARALLDDDRTYRDDKSPAGDLDRAVHDIETRAMRMTPPWLP